MPSPKHILIVGGDSCLGSALARAHEQRGDRVRKSTRREGVVGTYHLDLARVPANWVAPTNIDVAYVCAGVTSILQCEKRPDETAHINVQGTLQVCRALHRAGAFVVFFSTNLVFDGDTPLMPVDAPVRPRCAYGHQKAAVEAALRGEKLRSTIIRLSKVVDSTHGLFKTWRDLLTAGQSIAAFDDMTVAPIRLESVVRASTAAADQRFEGIVHLSAAHDITYFDAARRLARNIGASDVLVQPASASSSFFPGRFIPRHTTLAPATAAGVPFDPPDPFSALDVHSISSKESLSVANLS